MGIEWLDPAELLGNVDSISIYGDQPDPELLESVDRFGVFEDHPIGYVIDDSKKRVVSGHRRRQAALLKKKPRVPCIRLVDIEDDPLAIKERIVLSNRHRHKTTEQLAREAALLAEVESERALERQKSSLKTGANSPSVSIDTDGKNKGKTREKVAGALGVSEATAQRLVTAGTALVSAEKSGNKVKAAKIRNALAVSARAGAKAAKPAAAKPQKNGQPTVATFNEKSIDEPYGKLLRAVDARLKAFPADGKYKHVRALLGQVWKAILDWRR